MPLSRVEVRNEYGLGAPILYENGNNEGPKAVLEGAAVAGLVGILRQLGDLAEFAAEVFHDLQEEVIITSSRSRKLMARVRQIDKAVPSLEKVVLAQRSHLHLAYTAGCNWHASVKCGQNHFASGDMPEFIIDSYEDCRGPPRFHLLDKFDPGGPGSCLRRYSDPALFKRASTGYGEESTKKIEKDKEVHRTKRRRSRLRNGKVSRGASIPNHSVRMQFPQLNVDDQDSASQTAPVNEKTLRSDFVDQPKIASRNELGYIECVHSPSYSTKPHPQECRESPSSSKRQSNVSPSCNFVREKGSDVHDDSQNNFSVEKIGYSPSVSWDEKEEMHEPLAECDRNGNLGLLPKDSLSPSRRKLGDSPGYNFLEENYSDVYDDTRNSLSLEQTGHSSSSVNWDEKAEILEHTTEYDRDEYLGSLPSNFELQMHGCKADNFKIFEQIDILPCNETVPVPESGDNQLDDRHFLDALNTIQSESETDKDCTMKHELLHMTGEDGKVSTCSQSSILSSNKDEGKPDPVGNSDNDEHGIHMDCITSCEDYREDGISCRKESWKHSPADLNVNLENFSDSTHRQYAKTQAVNSEVQMPEEHQQNNQSSSQMSELDNRLTNGSNNRLSLAMYENYGPTNDVKADVLKQDNDPIVLPTIMSPSSSPPLERMKILFCPLQDFEMSKLKLKFPDGNGNPESSRDFFPSFQLVPEPDFAWHNVGSESDNHTFYSSSPSVSDDCLSPQSESNSEQWESSECRSNKDDNLYNALYRISLTDSISTQNESTSHGEICDSTELRFHHSLNLPSLDSLNHSFGEDRLNTLSEGPKIANHAVHLKLSASTISQDQIVETIDLLKSKHVQENIPKETNQVARGKSMDEQGDLLSQTRTKSINDFRSISLRPTVSIKPTTPMGPPANANITAILEKANAIRQAVGSDDGEDDDNWSDT